MHSRRLRSLRVQVLLWTILPLTIVLLIVTLNGIGSNQSAIRRIIVDENLRLNRVAAEVVANRLAAFPMQLQTLALVAPQARATDAPVVHGSLGSMEFWYVAKQGGATNAEPAPGWVNSALAARDPALPPSQPSMLFDTATDQIIWVVPDTVGRGALVGAVPTTAIDLDPLLETVQPGPTGAVAIVDDRGQVIVERGPPDAALRFGASWPIAGGSAADSGVKFDKTGEESVMAYGPIPNSPWALVIRRPMNALLASALNFEQNLPVILLAVAAVSFLTLYFGLNLVVRPLRTLALQASRIGQGEYDAAAQFVGGVVEIEDLRQSLDLMAQRILRDQTSLQTYLRAVTNAQEEERSRLARELHDDTVQTLIALDHKAQMVQRLVDKNPERAREQCVEFRVMLAGAAQEVRRMSQALRPLYLEEVGLGPAVEMLARDAAADFQLLGSQCRLDPEEELALFRIAQESLNNARHHAQAHTIRVMLAFGPSTITLGVGDDGVGFQRPVKLSDLAQHGHLGLMGISERTQLIQGLLLLESQPGDGTVLIVQAPYTKEQSLTLDNAQVTAVRGWLRD